MRAHELRRRAIAAVAKLSIFAGAAGCTGNVILDTDETEPDQVDPDDSTSSSQSDYSTTEPDPTTSTTASTSTEPETACTDGSDIAVECCGTVLATAFADDHLFVDPSLATEVETACCELATDTMDTWAGGDPAPFDHQTPYHCCNTGLAAGGWEEHPSCAPWGPPMPPAMPRPFRSGSIARERVLA